MTAAAPKPPAQPLARAVTSLVGVGSERAAQLAKLEIHTIEELLLHRPRRYEDRGHFRPIAEVIVDEPATTRGRVIACGLKWFSHHTKSIFELILDDGTARLHCRWWNLPFMEKYFVVGDEVVVFGKVESLKPRTMDHPETEVVETGEESFIHLNRITPIYSLTEGLPQRWLRALIWRTLGQFETQIPNLWEVGVPPSGGRAAKFAQTAENSDAKPPKGGTPNLSRARAIRLMHFPEALEDIERARRRLALDEFIELQRQILIRRRNFESKAQALPCGGDNHLIKPFLARLGFKLTEAQTKVLREMRQDLSGRHPMRRLLQGDVGSGKTVVAGCCALMALESGYNAALMAPTEILAEQHFRTFTKWFEPLGIGVELQTGSRKTVLGLESKVLSQDPKVGALSGKVGKWESGSSSNDHPATHPRAHAPTFTIGTHALIEAGFMPENLGLVIIDEQHRFGVAQREKLVRKGRYPHLLVMTATPIPRTLGLTLYGELDVSVIEGMPPGRGRTKTFLRSTDMLPRVWDFVRQQLAAGRQAYVVYPRIEETSQKGLKAVTKEWQTLQKNLAPFKVGLIHGRLKSAEKESAMRAFRENSTQVLLATSLIEVGVDVPNATVMLIENAEQFGLAQLHQLRGRIGRGARDAYCILVASNKGPDSVQRLKVLEQTTDGFQIAEADLKLRGPGEMLGQQQSGLPKFRFGDLAADFDLVREARELAGQIVREGFRQD